MAFYQRNGSEGSTQNSFTQGRRVPAGNFPWIHEERMPSYSWEPRMAYKLLHFDCNCQPPIQKQERIPFLDLLRKCGILAVFWRYFLVSFSASLRPANLAPAPGNIFKKLCPIRKNDKIRFPSRFWCHSNHLS